MCGALATYSSAGGSIAAPFVVPLASATHVIGNTAFPQAMPIQAMKGAIRQRINKSVEGQCRFGGRQLSIQIMPLEEIAMPD
ncbi:MAG: hypothetical protein JNG88_14855 [Phycisphaerales bacterium]|nr:hypothetical protein [Phycisphaerales bacterium]